MRTAIAIALAALAALVGAGSAAAQANPEPQIVDHERIAIADAFPALEAGRDHVLHARKIVLAPGARTAMVDRAGRPAITYVTRGEVLEHREGVAEPIRHTLHAATMDRAGVRHFWENAGAAPAELLVVELVKTP